MRFTFQLDEAVVKPRVPSADCHTPCCIILLVSPPDIRVAQNPRRS